jgi:hypothetical protein
MISEERKNIKRSIPVALGRAELTMISARKCMEIVGDSGAIKTRKKLTTDCLTLDLRRLGQKSRLIPNTCLQWVWKDVRGNVQGTVGIFLWTDEIELIYGQSAKPKSEPIRERILLTSTNCHGGGHRLWFLCPGCRSRRAILYLEQELFRCRWCNKLAYASQYPSRGRSYGRLHRMLETS